MENGNPTLAGVKLVIYKKIVLGDFRKFQARSNNASTGGGARDLRFRPATEFSPQFNRMFTTPGADGSFTGQFYWPGLPPTDVTIHQPTRARPGEVRIGMVHQCFPVQSRPTNSEDCILLLILDSYHHVWPSFTSERSLRNDDWNHDVRDPILRGLDSHRSARITPMGYVDIENGREWNNGR